MKFSKLHISPTQTLQRAGWDWMLGESTLPYVTDEMILVSTTEAEAYFQAVNQLYEMYVEAAQYVLDHQLWNEMGIPSNLIPLIEYSWQNENHWHIYGRFDLSGGLDGQPIKLIEFNADTATCIPETAIVQWASLKANGFDEAAQFNTLYESLVNQFRELKHQNRHLTPTLLISTMEGFPEDDTNVQVLGEAASEAGFEVAFEYIEKVEFSATEGIFKQNETDGRFTRYDFWFKLVPWEYIAWDEPALADILTSLVCANKVVVINPAYTLLFQSKGMLKVLWDLYPNHPLLLAASKEILKDGLSVQKVLFGREGANVNIVSANGETLAQKTGEYFEQSSIYQAYTEFVKDTAGFSYQAGVFIAGEACGLGFRKGGKIIDNTAQFCGHMIED